MNIAIFFGGKSAEHEVSVQSSKNIVDALDKDKFQPVLIGISKKGKWFLYDQIPQKEVQPNSNEVSITPGGGNKFLKLKEKEIKIEAVFPVLHGPNGEDGTIQGLFKMVDIPFVGPDVLGSAIAMDKVVAKSILKERGILTADFISFKKRADLDLVEKKFNYPVFVKPANLGSSVGVSKAKNREELKKAVQDAFDYDNKILVEEFIEGKELECSVLGNKNPKSSRVGEIRPKDFYSYEEKYSDKSSTELIIPAQISSDLEEKIREKAVKTFKALQCQGMARVDFLISGDKIYVNEVNTIPGFTRISMYPKLWQETGIGYQELITRLINLAIERDKSNKRLKTSY